MHRPQAQSMVDWFLAHYAGAADLLPDRDGPAAAPYDPRTELMNQFPDATAYDLDAAIAELQQQGYDWAPIEGRHAAEAAEEAALVDLTSEDVTRPGH